MQGFSGRETGNPADEIASEYHDEVEKLNSLAHRIRNNGIEAHAIIIEGIPSLSILKEAQVISADLIVIGTHRHGMVTRLMLGGVSQAIIKASECPILLVPIIN